MVSNRNARPIDRIRNDLTIIRLLLLEEYRMQTSMIGRFQFLFFPVIIMVFCLVMSLASTDILEDMSIEEIYTLLHSGMFLYALAVGGFALFGESIAERRLGQVDLLLSTPLLLPLDFRRIFSLFYIKDILFYLVFTILPIVVGITLSVPVTGFRLSRVLFLLVTLDLTFLLGISLSFFLSTLYVRAPHHFSRMFPVLGAGLLFLISAGIISAGAALPTLGVQNDRSILHALLSLGLILLFSIFAVQFLRIDLGKRSGRFSHEIIRQTDQFRHTGIFQFFIAKDWIDMKRSRTLFPIIGAYIIPMVFLSLILWFLRTAIDVSMDFNIVFFSAMIGFFGITIYSWLNIIDSPAVHEYLPVDVPTIIRAKLSLFLLLSFPISSIFIMLLAVSMGETDLLPVALFVSWVTTPYTAVMTAYLTGLRTNSYLFDPIILGRFMGLVALPLIVITFASFSIEDNFTISTTVIFVICALLIVLLTIAYWRIGDRWGRESFIY
jgi:hypothetical protein